jgi:phosphate transport system permease protein
MAPGTLSAERKSEVIRARIKQRYAAERRFRAYGIAAILFGLAFLVALFSTILARGYTAFQQSTFTLDVVLDQAAFGSAAPTQSELRMADYTKIANRAIQQALGVDPANKADARAAADLLSQNADTQIRKLVMADPSLVGQTVKVDLLAHGNVDSLLKGQFDRSVSESRRKLSDKQLGLLDAP